MALLFSDDLCSAFLAEIVSAFEKKHRRHYLGRTAMQKLAYFAQALGVPLPCSFEIYNFGPYSDSVMFALQSMVADDVIEDRSQNPKYSDYRLKHGHASFSPEIQDRVVPYRTVIENVVQTLGGYDPPQLELIATLHFIASKLKSIGNSATKETVMDEFFRIKGDKFLPKDVSSWYDALKSTQLV